MSLTQALQAFIHDKTVLTVLALIALDFVLGVAAAFKDGTFKIGWLHGFLQTDVLQKLLPFFAIYYGAKVATGSAWFQGTRDVVVATVIGAVGSSILSSLNDLGFKSAPVTGAFAGSDLRPSAVIAKPAK